MTARVAVRFGLVMLSCVGGCASTSSGRPGSLPACSNLSVQDRLVHPAVIGGEVHLDNSNFQQLVEVPTGTSIVLDVSPVAGVGFYQPTSSNEQVVSEGIVSPTADRGWEARFTSVASGEAQLRARTMGGEAHEAQSVGDYCVDVRVNQ